MYVENDDFEELRKCILEILRECRFKGLFPNGVNIEYVRGKVSRTFSRELFDETIDQMMADGRICTTKDEKHIIEAV